MYFQYCAVNIDRTGGRSHPSLRLTGGTWQREKMNQGWVYPLSGTLGVAFHNSIAPSTVQLSCVSIGVDGRVVAHVIATGTQSELYLFTSREVVSGELLTPLSWCDYETSLSR